MLKITGTSQWGETYDISGVTMNGRILIIEWTNSIGEHGRSTITRDDDINWADLISNSGSNVGFDWTIVSGNDDDAFTVDYIGNITVNNSSNLDYETESTRVLTLTASDGEFASAEETIITLKMYGICQYLLLSKRCLLCRVCWINNHKVTDNEGELPLTGVMG